MHIQFPTEEENRKQRKIDRQNFIGGIIVGCLIFGLIGIRLMLQGYASIYTWIALGFGALSFGFLAKWFGAEFWQRLLSKR
jgi:predicted tellurium resistance membrane protein TerC